MGNYQNNILSEQLFFAIEGLSEPYDTKAHRFFHKTPSIDGVKELIKRGARVNRPHNGTLPLHIACLCEDTECLELLLKKGAKVNKVDDSQRTALHCVANRKSNSTSCVEFVDVLIGHGADINARSCYKQTPLHYAVSCYKADYVKLLLEYGADIDVHGFMERTPLHCAVYSKKILSQHGADINAVDESKQTPLHYAVYGNNVECVKLLLQHGADVNAVDESKQTPLHYAANGNNVICVELLLQHGANVDDLDNNHNSALNHAACFYHIEIIKILLDYSADVNNRNVYGYTPLMSAVMQSTKLNTQRVVACVELLIQASGQFDLRDVNCEIIPELSEILLPYCVSPRSLQVLCRYQIRSSLRNQFLPDVISSLNLPQRLQRCVLLQR